MAKKKQLVGLNVQVPAELRHQLRLIVMAKGTTIQEYLPEIIREAIEKNKKEVLDAFK